MHGRPLPCRLCLDPPCPAGEGRSQNKRECSRALKACLALQVVHCDLKAKNVLLTEDRRIAKIGDVGLARMMAETHLSTASGFFGTFAYTAPEVLGRRRCNEKVRCTATCLKQQYPVSAGLHFPARWLRSIRPQHKV